MGLAAMIFWPKVLTRLKELIVFLIRTPFFAFSLLLKLIRLKRRSDPFSVEIKNHTIPSAARLRHTHIVGATGSGKTVLIEKLLFQDLKNGLGALVIDPKGDRELFERVRSYCASIGRMSDLHYLSATHADESEVWNPCQLGNASNLQTKFYHSNTFSEPHYAKACEKGLLRSFENLLRTKPKGFALPDLVREIEILNREEKNQTLEGLTYDFYNLANGEWSPILGSESLATGKPSVSLLEITKKNEILFVDLPTEASAIQSARVGKLLLQEMMLISGLRKSHPELRSPKPFSIYIDEFDAFATESFVTFLNKGRSSGFMIHLAHQTLSDLLKISPSFSGQVMGNTNVRFIFRQDEPKDAETWSKFFGTKTAVKKTWQTKSGISSGLESNREVLEFRIKPDSIKVLKTGECVISVKTENILETIQLDPPAKISDAKFILDRTPQSHGKMTEPRKVPIASQFKFSAEELRAESNPKPKGKSV